MIKFRKCQGVLGGEVCSFMFLTCTVYMSVCAGICLSADQTRHGAVSG